MNQRLREMDVQFIDAEADGSKDFSGVKQGEVVILPAFGASVQEMKLLADREVQIVDTTCPWVRCARGRVAGWRGVAVAVVGGPEGVCVHTEGVCVHGRRLWARGEQARLAGALPCLTHQPTLPPAWPPEQQGVECGGQPEPQGPHLHHPRQVGA